MDKLFLLNPNFKDDNLEPAGQLYYCPFNAMLEGVLHYYPELRDKLDITYVDFPRPRKEIVKYLGEENQGSPVLIIREEGTDLANIKVQKHNGNQFIHGNLAIAKYLARKFDIPQFHP